MKKTLLAELFFFLIITSLSAQEAIFRAEQLTSPEIEGDVVTFRFYAPKAQKVEITGDFLPTEKIDSPMGTIDSPGKAALTINENGVWEFKIDKLQPELYSYSFHVDGLPATDPNNPFLIRDVASVTNIFIIEGAHADLYRVQKVPHGTVAKRWYPSDGLQMERRLTVYTPPGYESSAEKYPVLYLLHGAGGDEEAWISLGRTAQILDNLINQGKAKPMIVVMPNGNVIQDAAPGEGTLGFYKPQFMIPKTMDGTYEENFMEIVNFIDKNYRTVPQKSHRAIAGLSMGGFHTMHVSRFFPDTFDFIGLYSAAIMPREDASGKVYKDIEGTLKVQRDNGYKLYWIAIGKTDFLYDANQEFKKLLDEIDMPYTYVESEGGHIWRNWRVYLSQFAPQLFE
ncbi:alpha/beta hydrolase-fold protein [Belliella sp. DSM 111904]|uniref:Alpha/beta hydrolase-fold protein n=1 Tax=Belliella filtrata TaxID=2923435 RepID=A0ABS9UUK1_9BACT|nr:esterase [Belliella filtrata]MCH7407846.1 alpha/beta hydrolase-fold protein [Belliella filtrata]